MENLLTYIIQVNLLLTLIYLGYHFLLKGLTFCSLNRMYFIVGGVYAFVYPFLDIKSWFLRHDVSMGQDISDLWLQLLASSTIQRPSEVLTLTDVLLGIVGFVGVIFFLKLLTQLISLLRIHIYSKNSTWQSYVFRNVLFPVVPFSFFNKIYLHKEQHQEKELHDIFAHEIIHVRGHHTVDILLFEMILVVCWYNPFVWLMRKAVRQNLEFLTDQQVLNKGVDKQTYQYSLLHVTQRGAAVDIGNQFNFKTLKKRIMMMNKKRSSRLELSKYAFLLPVFLIAGVSFTVSKAEKDIEKIVEKTHQTTVLSEPLQVKMKGEVGELLKQTVGTGILAIDTSKQEYYNVDYPLVPSNFNKEELRGKNFFFKIDDKLVWLDEFYDFPRNEIFGLDIYSNKDEIFKKVGKQNAEGLFVISTIKWAEKNLPVEHLEKLVKNGNMRGLTFTVEENGKKRLIKGQAADVDKLRKQFPHVYATQLKGSSSAPIDTTKSITIKSEQIIRLKNKSEIDPTKKLVYLYDQKVISKEEFYKMPDNELLGINLGLGHSILQGRYRKDISNPENYDGFVSASSSAQLAKLEEERKKILIVVDDISKPIGFDMNTLDPNKIKSVSVIKGSDATAIYGDKGENGVVVIKTKQDLSNSANKIKKISGVSINDNEGGPASKSLEINVGDDASLSNRNVRVSPPLIPLYIVDGKEQPADFDMYKIEEGEIASLNILKGKAAKEAYGDKGKNGVIEITTKKNKAIVVRGYKAETIKSETSKRDKEGSTKEVVVTGYKN